MSMSRIFLALLFALPLGGCQPALWGNIAVLGITFGIFFGTLALGRATTPSSKSAESSSSASSPIRRS